MVPSSSVSTALTEIIGRLESALREARCYELRVEELQRRLEAARAHERGRDLALAAADERAARVTSLYVATYQLHASLDPADVRATIAEIASNLLGAERFVLLLRATPAGACEVALEEGLQDNPSALFVGGRYEGRSPTINATLTDGVLRVADAPDADVLAVVPLVVQDAVVGALVILKLLAHRGSLAEQDRDLLDLLGAHAASALFVAQVHTNADRKLKSLESQVKALTRAVPRAESESAKTMEASRSKPGRKVVFGATEFLALRQHLGHTAMPGAHTGLGVARALALAVRDLRAQGRR